MPKIENNIADVSKRIEQSATNCGRDPHSIVLLAVSKTRSVEHIRQAMGAGLTQFAENYLQEALDKIAQLEGENLCWHFIGPLQSNKTRNAAEHFSWVHSVDRLKIAQRLNDQRPESLGPLNICLQVNIDNEPSKSGFAPEALLPIALQIAELPNLRLRGLMAIPRAENSFEAQQTAFYKLAQLREQINQSLDNSEKLDTLSMGMSGDLEAAISQGSTMVRVGTDIFGKREQQQ
ncbi:YggS family pyridoxal phosphate-dependent enzyme [Porticoccaceae bacterium]|nr:YggS family pyridoxal phosphate-dependent enzyme [Porticoccaceae bacterium]